MEIFSVVFESGITLRVSSSLCRGSYGDRSRSWLRTDNLIQGTVNNCSLIEPSPLSAINSFALCAVIRRHLSLFYSRHCIIQPVNDTNNSSIYTFNFYKYKVSICFFQKLKKKKFNFSSLNLFITTYISLMSSSNFRNLP